MVENEKTYQYCYPVELMGDIVTKHQQMIKYLLDEDKKSCGPSMNSLTFFASKLEMFFDKDKIDLKKTIFCKTIVEKIILTAA